jgi:hypothetical protein
MNNKNKAKNLHITNGNCSPPCSGGSGYEKPQSGLRPLCGFVSATFGAWVVAAQRPITCPKRQLPRTLCEIKIEKLKNHRKLIDKYLYKISYKIMRKKPL